MLTDRACKILYTLYQHMPKTLSAKKIALLSNMSERTVSTYIKEIITFCETNNYQLISKPGVGISLYIKDEQKEAFLKIVKQVDKYSSHYRVWYIISLLLNNWSLYTTALFADDLYVSKKTIINDLKKAEQWLNRFNITLCKKAGSGICLEAEEIHIRHALVAINRRYDIGQNEPAAADETGDCRLSWQTQCRLKKLYNSLNFSFYIHFIREYEKAFDVTLTQESFEMVLEYILVQQKRCSGKHYIRNDTVLFQLNPKIKDLLTGLLDKWQKYFLLDHGREFEYLLKLLLAAQWQQRNPNITMDRDGLLQEVIQYISDLLSVDLWDDRLLLKDLENYIPVVCSRTFYGFHLQNPILNAIKKAYPVEFGVCYAVGKFFKTITGCYPTEDEIAYLTLLVAKAVERKKKIIKAIMIAPLDGAVEAFIIQQLKGKIPEIHMIQTVSCFDSTQIDRLLPQMIITTMPTYKNSHYPVVAIAPTLTETDIKRLKKACDCIHTKKEQQIHEKINLQCLFKDELIFPRCSFQNKEKLIQFAAQKLFENGNVNKDFCKNVLEREHYGSTALGKGVAIPHSVAAMVNVPAICTVTLEEAMPWDEEFVNIVFVLALDFIDIQSTSVFFKCFHALTSNRNTVRQLKDALTKNDIKKILLERV